MQAANAGLFATGIAHAPVAGVLFAVATVPIWSSLMGAAFLGDRAEKATFAASAAVFAGIGISVSGGSRGGTDSAITGAACGLVVALSLASSFTLYRANPPMPAFLTVGVEPSSRGASAPSCRRPSPLRMVGFRRSGWRGS